MSLRVVYRSPKGLDFEYKEDSVVVSGHLVTRLVPSYPGVLCSVLNGMDPAVAPELVSRSH